MASQDIEMQYKAPEPMSPSNAEQREAANTTEEQPKQRTILGMRGGGLILDLCACFICCECMKGCCESIDACCCC